MDFEEANTILFVTLHEIYPIATARVSMMATNNRYARFPFLRFRFKDKDKEDLIYEKIRDTVKNFKGLLAWEMVTKYDTLNYLIVPSYVCFGQEELTGDLNEHLKMTLGESLFRKRIDQAIEDIPNLAHCIKTELLGL